MAGSTAPNTPASPAERPSTTADHDRSRPHRIVYRSTPSPQYPGHNESRNRTATAAQPPLGNIDSENSHTRCETSDKGARMNGHPDTAAAAARGIHIERIAAARRADLINQARALGATGARRPSWFARITCVLAGRRHLANVPTAPMTSSPTARRLVAVGGHVVESPRSIRHNHNQRTDP
jgi:hypothetical protein